MKLILTLAILGSIGCAQTRLATPVTILPNAPHTVAGSLVIDDATTAKPLTITPISINAGSIGAPFTVIGSTLTDSRIVLQPGTTSGSNWVESTADILPTNVNSQFLGRSSQRWGDLYTTLVDVNVGSSGSTPAVQIIDANGTGLFVNLTSTNSSFSAMLVESTSSSIQTATIVNFSPSNTALFVQGGSAPFVGGPNGALVVESNSTVTNAAAFYNNSASTTAVLASNSASGGTALIVSGITTLDGQLNMQGDILPTLGILYNLGSGSFPFKGIFGQTENLAGVASTTTLNVTGGVGATAVVVTSNTSTSMQINNTTTGSDLVASNGAGATVSILAGNGSNQILAVDSSGNETQIVGSTITATAGPGTAIIGIQASGFGSISMVSFPSIEFLVNISTGGFAGSFTSANCNGSPTASFQVRAGIVTHC